MPGSLQNAKLVSLDAIPGNNLLDILGHVLNKSVLHLSRRGFELDIASYGIDSGKRPSEFCPNVAWISSDPRQNN
jgi:hypothetical protein